jgi:hypothetical protein
MERSFIYRDKKPQPDLVLIDKEEVIQAAKNIKNLGENDKAKYWAFNKFVINEK